MQLKCNDVATLRRVAGSLSWVRERSGSWFMQKTLDVFERHYKRRHVEEMMTVISLVVAEQRGNVSDGEAVQMPCKFSTLRMQFYL